MTQKINVLIFENEYQLISTPFEYVNEIYYRKRLNYTVYPNSQDLKPFTIISEYDIVFVDISLGKNSELDGFGILKQIDDLSLNIKNLVILTGNHAIEQMLQERGIKKKYKLLTKPIDFNDLLKVFKNMKK